MPDFRMSVLQGSIESFLTASGEFVFTLTNNGYKFITLNLVRQIQALRVPWKLCIVCADKASHAFFSREGIPCRRITTPLKDMGPALSPFGSRNFQSLNHTKLDLLADLVGRPEIQIGVYLDGDIAVYRDFLPDLAGRLRGAAAPAYLFQCDEQSREDCTGPPCSNFCTGFIAWRHGAAEVGHFAIRTAEDKALWSARPEDQVYVNAKIQSNYQILPRRAYPNGMFASMTGIKDTAYILHYNWLVGESKAKKMKINGDWVIPY